MLGAKEYRVKSPDLSYSLWRQPERSRFSGEAKDLLPEFDIRLTCPTGRAIIRVRLHPNRGNPVISSEGESCAIHSSLKKDL